MSARKNAGADDSAGADRPYLKTEDVFGNVIAGLPIIERTDIEELEEALRLLPASGKRFLLGKLLSGNATEKALAWRLLLDWGRPVIDDLNAIIFDGSQSDEAKILANELLADMDSPVDPDVFEMSLRNAEKRGSPLPWQAVRDLAAGDAESAVRRLEESESGARAILIHRLAEKSPADSMPVFEKFAMRDEESALTVVSALQQFPNELAGKLLADLADSEFRPVQKAARKALHSMRTSGMEVPDEPVAAAEAPPAEKKEEAGPPVYKALLAQSEDGSAALALVAREYPNGRIQAITVGMDYWKSGIRGARYYLDMSKSRLRKLVSEGDLSRVKLRECAIEEARRAVARGIRVAREVKSPLPFDLQAGKHLLGDIMAEADAIGNPFLCSRCDAPLSGEQVKKVVAAAHYPQMRVETRCENCRGAGAKSDR